MALVAPLAGAAAVGATALAAARAGRPAPRGPAAAIACAAPLASFAIALVLLAALRAMPEGARVLEARAGDWIAAGRVHVPIGLLLDPLSVTMLLVVTGIGGLIHIYSIGYMAHDRGFVRYFAYLNLFVFFMLLLVLGDSLPLLFVGWEGVGLCSYLLIGFWFEDPAKAAAGKKAFVVNRIGDFGFLLGILLVFWTMAGAGHPTLAFRDLAAHRDALAGGVATAAALLLFVGACGKSAQIPLYVWLPDAMAGPTPVSALIHAATMVTAGVYMVARLGWLYDMAPAAGAVVAVVGLATALLAATIALVETDIKKVLAYSTVSQLGYMFLGAGSGAYGAAIFHVVTHAFFKACLFLGAGSVIHALHEEQDVRKMGGLARGMRWTAVTFLVSTAAIAGFPPLSGFFSKDAILAHVFAPANPALARVAPLLYALALAGAALTAFYMFRLAILVFFGAPRGEAAAHPHESPAVMTAPLALLAAGAAAAGLLGVPHALGGGDRVVGWLAEAVTGGGGAAHGAHATPDAPELPLMALSVAAALAGALVARHFYVTDRAAPERLARRAASLDRLFRGRWFVDEAYDRFVVRPLGALSRGVLWKRIDVGVIDRAVNGVGGVAEAGSYFLRLAHSGQVQTYGIFLLLGIALLALRFL
jgi:NADH-quinone oxidoreductase subunit L